MPNDCGGDSQHLNEDGVRVYDYGEEVQNGHACVHRDHQKSHDKPKCDGDHCRQVEGYYDARLVLNEGWGGNEPSALNRCNGVAKHANSDHPNALLLHVDRRYGGDGNDRHDANGHLQYLSDLQIYQNPYDDAV